MWFTYEGTQNMQTRLYAHLPGNQCSALSRWCLEEGWCIYIPCRRDSGSSKGTSDCICWLSCQASSSPSQKTLTAGGQRPFSVALPSSLWWTLPTELYNLSLQIRDRFGSFSVCYSNTIGCISETKNDLIQSEPAMRSVRSLFDCNVVRQN